MGVAGRWVRLKGPWGSRCGGMERQSVGVRGHRSQQADDTVAGRSPGGSLDFILNAKNLLESFQ